MQKEIHLYEKYVTNYEHVTTEMHSLETDQKFLILKAMQIQCDDDDSRLALRVATDEYCMAELKPKIKFFISHSTLQSYNGELVMSASQYK